MNSPLGQTGTTTAAEFAGPTRTAKRAWVIMALLLVFMLINFADKAVLGLAAKPIMRDLGLSPAEYGLLSSSFYFLFSISAIVLGFVSNRFPSKWILLIIAAIWAITQVPMVGTVGFAVLLASRVVLGAAEGPANPLAAHAAYKWFPNEKRNLPTSLLNIGAGVGSALAAPLLTGVIVAYGWHSAFLVLFIVGLVWVVLWWLLGKEGNVASTTSVHHTEPVASSEEPRLPYRKIMLSGTWLTALIGGFASYWAMSLLLAWVPSYLETVLGYSATATGNLVVLPWVCFAILLFGQGIFTDHLMHRGVSSRKARGWTGAAAVLIAGTAMLLLPVMPAGAGQIVALTIAFSVGTIFNSVSIAVNAEISPTRQRAAVMGTCTGLVTTAGLIAPYLTGQIIQTADSPTAGYTLSFTIAGILLLASGVLALFFMRPEHTRTRIGLNT